MHFGFLVARCEWAALRAELERHGVRDEGVVTEPAGGCVGGEHAGRAYVIDGEMMLSTSGDLVVELAARLHTLVVGCGAETVSGTSWLFAAEDGQPLRSVWSCAEELAVPFAQGAWPPGRPVAIDDLDGDGLRTILRRAGFDADGIVARGRHRRLALPDDLDLPRGVVDAAIAAHRQAHLLPSDRRPEPQLVVRAGAARGGAARPGFVAKLRRFFGR